MKVEEFLPLIDDVEGLIIGDGKLEYIVSTTVSEGELKREIKGVSARNGGLGGWLVIDLKEEKK